MTVSESELSWSPQQSKAIKAVLDWYKDEKGPQIFRLFGYAGTGKTTLAKEIERNITGKVLYAAFTGKAALVLQKKLCSASTIHSLIYNVERDNQTGELTFDLNYNSPLKSCKLLIVDEVSMVDELLADDLLSFGVKILVLGDPAQLPPVKGKGFFIEEDPDIMLTEIHRQAKDNPIIRMSMDVREGKGLKPGKYGDSLVVKRQALPKEHLTEYFQNADQVLCGMNRTRQMFNQRMRDLHGFKGVNPQVGDKVVCLKNNMKKGLLNGGLWDVLKVKGEELELTSLDYKSPETEVHVHPAFWTGDETSLDWMERKLYDEFTYGYCLTVHKAQGSQWDDLVLFDESRVFRKDAQKHLYTGITRAAEKIVVVL